MLAGLVLVWVAAIWSLVDGPTGAWSLAVLYAAVTLAGPVLLWSVRGFAAFQRARFRTLLGAEIPAPPRGTAGGWPPLRPVRAGRALLGPSRGLVRRRTDPLDRPTPRELRSSS